MVLIYVRKHVFTYLLFSNYVWGGGGEQHNTDVSKFHVSATSQYQRTTPQSVRFQVLTVASINMAVFSDAARYNLVETDRCFRD
jgi:hypothetical protein